MTAKLPPIPALLALTVALALPRAATAVDGVIEINQARALAGSVTATDMPGFPVTIDSSGSYRLTGNLTVDGPATGIDVFGQDVTLDLNGFAIVRGSPPGCCTGIFAPGSTRIMNGTIRGFSNGIWGGSLWVSGVHVVGIGSGAGIATGIYSVVTDSVVEHTSGGIGVGSGSVVRGCTSRNNASTGIQSGVSSLVSGNSVIENAVYGILAADGSTVVGNNVNSNGVGVFSLVGVTLLDNTARSNTGLGFSFAGANNAYARNVLTNNNGGDGNAQVGGAGSGTQLGTNICGNDTVCP
jgi:hypothetical protein